ncbi:MAG: M48 family metalloprotease, partial [Myxococcota bacterium]
AAEAKIKSAPKAEQRRALGDTVEFLGETLATEARKQVDQGGADAVVRGENELARRAALEKLLAGPERGKVYTKAHEIAAMQEGIATAVRGQVDGTLDAGAARDRLIALVRDTTDAATLQVMRSAWVHLLGDHRRLDAALVGKLAEVLEAAVSTVEAPLAAAKQDALNELLGSIMGKTGAAMPTKKPARPSKIGGQDEAIVAKEIDQLAEQQGTGRLLFDVDRIRVPAYRKTLDAILADDSVKSLLPTIERIAKRQEEEALASQDIGDGIVLDRSTPRSYFRGVYKAIYDVTQATGRTLGFTDEIAVVWDPSLAPNAYVYTSAMERARVTVAAGLFEKLWSHNKGDWISVPVNDDGKAVAPGTTGAHDYPIGRLVAESVIAHELGHIRDEVVITDTLLLVLMQSAGVDLLKEVEQGTKVGQQLQEALTKRYGDELPLKILRDPSLLAQIPKDTARQVLRGAFPALREAFAADKGDKKANKEEQDAAAMAEFLKRFMVVSRAAESTADRFAAALQGVALPTQLTDYMLNTDRVLGTDEDKTRRLVELLEGDPAVWAKDKLDRSAKRGADDALAARDGQSHPQGAVRVADIEAYTHEDLAFRELQTLRALPAGERLLGLMQVYERAISERERAAEELHPQDQWDSAEGLRNEARLTHEVGDLGDKLGAFQGYFADLLKADGLGGREGVYVDRALDFIEAGGSTFTRELELTPGLEGASAEIRTADFPRVLAQLASLLTEARAQAKGEAVERIDERLARVADLQAQIATRHADRQEQLELRQLVSSKLGRLAD